MTSNMNMITFPDKVIVTNKGRSKMHLLDINDDPANATMGHLSVCGVQVRDNYQEVLRMIGEDFDDIEPARFCIKCGTLDEYRQAYDDLIQFLKDGKEAITALRNSFEETGQQIIDNRGEELTRKIRDTYVTPLEAMGFEVTLKLKVNNNKQLVAVVSILGHEDENLALGDSYTRYHGYGFRITSDIELTEQDQLEMDFIYKAKNYPEQVLLETAMANKMATRKGIPMLEDGEEGDTT